MTSWTQSPTPNHKSAVPRPDLVPGTGPGPGQETFSFTWPLVPVLMLVLMLVPVLMPVPVQTEPTARCSLPGLGPGDR